MKKIFTGIIALIIPLLLFAQTAKEAQDLEQIHKKINKIEKENARLKQQLTGVQKSIVKINEAEVKEQLDFIKQDSIAKAAQDTVRSYSGRFLEVEKDIAEIEHALLLRCIGMIVFVIVLILVIGFRWWTHKKTHRKELDELLGKMNTQREEREKRIAELRAVLDQSQNDLSAMKKETGDRLIALSDNIAHVDRNLQTLLAERSNNLEQLIKDGLTRIKKENEEGGREFLKKLENVQALITSVTSKINDLDQKLANLGKKLDDQIALGKP